MPLSFTCLARLNPLALAFSYALFEVSNFCVLMRHMSICLFCKEMPFSKLGCLEKVDWATPLKALEKAVAVALLASPRVLSAYLAFDLLGAEEILLLMRISFILLALEVSWSLPGETNKTHRGLFLKDSK